MIFRCAYPGCGARISESQRGRCDKHPRTFTRVRKLHSKQYGSSAWKRAREEIIQAYPLCLICFLEGVTEPAQEVDHIIPLDDNSDREQLTDPRNLAPLCKSHHVSKTRNDGNPAALEQYRQRIEQAKRLYNEQNATDATEEARSHLGEISATI
ncbi:TPA: HNH endonuclease signature motif containing protein [Aeromonas salmonicida subsp. pectinolytica]